LPKKRFERKKIIIRRGLKANFVIPHLENNKMKGIFEFFLSKRAKEDKRVVE